MDKFVSTFEDEFEGELDRSVWSGHYQWGTTTEARKGSYWNQYLAYTQDGSLVIPVTYLEEGMGGKGAGWYSAGIDTDTDSPNHFSQKFGYFECRCILPKGAGLNPAFWLLSDGMWADDTDGGITGAEIDILETNTLYNPLDPSFNSIVQTIHVDAYDEAHKWENQGEFYANDPYNEFNTYGVEWNENEYMFYVNGVETARTSFGGVCRVPLYLIISLGVDERVYENEHLPASMVVDYVRCYQYK